MPKLQSHTEKHTIGLPTRLILSAVSGMGAATVCHPLDVIRVQMQISNGKENAVRYRNAWHAATSIYRTSGLVQGLYAGISAAYLRQWLYGSCRMGIYSYLLEHAQQQQQRRTGDKAVLGSKQEISFAIKLAMGSISGGIGSFVGTPADLALVRMSADSKLPVSERRNYISVVNCLVRIQREEGWTQLWRGATPTVARAAVLSSCLMAITSETKEGLKRSGYFGPNGEWGQGYPLLFCATTVASFFATVAANPFDVVKSRLQQMKVHDKTSTIHTQHAPVVYAGAMDCLQKSIRAEGLSVLYAGFTPAFLKMAPYAIISLTLADKLTRAWTGRDAL